MIGGCGQEWDGETLTMMLEKLCQLSDKEKIRSCYILGVKSISKRHSKFHILYLHFAIHSINIISRTPTYSNRLVISPRERNVFWSMQTWHQLSASHTPRQHGRPASQIQLLRLTGQHVEYNNRIGQSVGGQFSRILAKNSNSKFDSNSLGHALNFVMILDNDVKQLISTIKKTAYKQQFTIFCSQTMTKLLIG